MMQVAPIRKPPSARLPPNGLRGAVVCTAGGMGWTEGMGKGLGVMAVASIMYTMVQTYGEERNVDGAILSRSA